MPVGQCKFTADIFKRNNNIDFCNIMGFFFNVTMLCGAIHWLNE